MAQNWPLLRLKWLLLAFTATITVACFYVWFTLFSSLGYEVPPESLELKPEQQHKLFVYGTLRNPLIRYLVIGRSVDFSPATISGFKRQGLDLQPARNSQVAGKLLVVNTEELRRLDRYERLGVRYERVRLTLDHDQEAWVYQRMEPP